MDTALVLDRIGHRFAHISLGLALALAACGEVDLEQDAGHIDASGPGDPDGALENYSLTITLDGSGSGTVTSAPSGIDCGSTCSHSFPVGTEVTLTATPAGQSNFGGWSGACSGLGSCVVTMDEAKSVTAAFNPPGSYSLSVELTGDGNGDVTSSPAGIHCGDDCTEQYVEDTVVTLTANAADDSRFTGWIGEGCSGTGTCVITMTGPTSVAAQFELKTFALEVEIAGTGEGGVTSDPIGINCGTDCAEAYPYGTTVTLFPETIGGSEFVGWSGDCSNVDECVVTMTSDKFVAAEFQAPSAEYNVAFVSPVPVNGNLGGLSGADDLCAQWGADAGFPGDYRAILSTSSVAANSRLAGARGWVRPDGRPVGDLPDELFSGSGPLAPLRITSTGEDVADARVWSASNNNGTFSTYHTDCINWTTASNTLDARYGFANVTSEWLDRGAADNCSVEYHLYCFQVDHNTPLDMDAFAEPGRRIFVTTGDFDTSTGLEGADSLCAADVAATPELAGKTFLAFLADNGVSAASRFTATETPIVRMDGLRVANDFDALITQDLIHPPAMRADGAYENWRVFSGAQTPTEAGTAATTCSGWSTASTGNAVESFAYSTSLDNADREWFGGSSGTCASHSGSIPIYCLEVE